ncbi:protocadherin-23 [Labeo rohita]|uniref:Protocadherin-16 n=1 Tax=Labeo rohita TaxID=84645 RepID=A0A498LE98_LABRO|nr:protocadherin-23 [Labeo rohita]
MELYVRTFLQFLLFTLFSEDGCAQVFNLSLSIEEGLPARTIVGDIRAGLPTKTQSSGFFISESRDSDVFRDFEIDGDTGIISTAVVLDRERTNKYEFAAATLTGEVIKVIIEVKDVNDHSPVFPIKTIQLNVSELSPPGTRFELEGAQDQDEGDYGIQGYRITDGDMKKFFKVEIRNSGGGMFSLDLILQARLDREIADFYNFTVEALDGGLPPKTGQLQVHITVLDENDNQPVFNQTEYHAVILESAPLMTPVCQVFATDPDLGSNGWVTYKINRRQSDPNEFFVIDSSSGIISVNKMLDYENQSFFELIVTAWDSGIQPESSSTFVSIKVLDANDNHPNISILFLNEAGAPEVSEGARPGAYVARIAVSDPDLGDVKKIDVHLQGGEGMFSLKSTDDFLYVLCVDGPLDRELKDLYELTVTAIDFGSPPLSSEATFQVQVTDVNDNPPVFDQDIYEESIPEYVHEGTSLFRVKATDRDLGGNSQIIYSIMQSEQEQLLNIDATSGLITTAAGLDHERETELRFLVVATDGGSPSLSSTATVTIHVVDVNDNKPVFKQQFYNVTIKEHTAVGACILQVTAIDADDAEFGSVGYSLYDGFSSKDDHPFFHINSITGEICVSQDIDHESGLVTFDLLIKAEDYDGLSSQTFVHIDVEDVNDNAPVFSPEKYVTSVSIHAQPGTELLSVFASDRDSGNNGKITYELLPGDSASLFTVDRSTVGAHMTKVTHYWFKSTDAKDFKLDQGSVYLNASLSQLRSSSVKLSVSAQDGGGMSAVYPANITVNILQSDQPPALFQKAHYTFSISEDAPVGSSVGLVQAVTPANSVEVVSYIISSGDPQRLFSIDSQSGIITTGQPLDHESLSYVILNIQFHMGTLPIYSSAQVNISITDVNDNPPVFQKTSEHITISHNTPQGTPLFIAHAHDADSGLNGRIHYMLHPESHLFSIHPYLGTLMLNGDLSGDSSQRYEFNIIAEDEGHPSLSSTLRLMIEMDSLDAVEDTLAFETLVYQVEIGESAPKDTRMIQVRAHGTKSQHGGAGGKAPPIITYSLKALSGVPPFRIHPETGWMFVSQSLDYETEPMYRFCVCAKAQNGKMEATATVVVMVQDENDNAPVFSRDVYFFSLQEGPSPHGMIGTVEATDRDSHNNGVLSYILLSDGKYFRVNPRTGEIINIVALDREEQTQHVLRVMVTDQGRPRLNTTTTVHILVTDVNDNPPKFTHLPATKELNVQVWAGIQVNSVVINMFAKDLDAGENGTVKFTIKDNRLGHFSIDSHNGDVRVTSRFSSNLQKCYTLRVVATDSGVFPLEETAVVHIQVFALDQQNGNSKDIQSLKHFTLREDVKVGTVIGSLGISNPPDMQLRYSIVEGDGSLQFGIKSSSGELYVAQHLDYEVTQRYFLVVRAEAPPTFNTTAFVAISVVDVNDHTPWFPGNDNFVVFGVYENVTNGTVVYVFNAHDGDGSLRNSELYYSLTYDPDPAIEGQPLYIDPHTGVIKTNVPLDRERTKKIVFRVTVSDNAEEPNDRKHTSVIGQVILLDINDNSPTFVSTEVACVPEDTEVGLLVHHVMAKDEDEGSNGHVIYSVISGNEKSYFHMESTGHLYLNSTLDYESQHVHILTVQARDSGVPSLSSTQTLTVKILDVNDNPPVFQKHIYNTSVMENREPREVIVTVTAVDLDSEMNSAVSYSLLPGPGYELFTVNSHTGQISTSTRLDREIQSSFTLRVQAEDSGTPSLSSTATVLCSVLDDNDNAPEFFQPDLHIVIPENLPPGVIHIFQASDVDNGLNGTIHYSIEEFEDCFSIDAVTGAISTTRILDREERSNYSLLITAADHGDPPLSSTALLHVTLSDENDNSPAFAQKSYRSSISEGLPAGSEILRLIAWDPDEGPNGVVTFSLEEENSGNFYVDGSTGVIRLTKPLDRETRSQHVFHAVATDGCSQGPRSTVATVTIQVEDINDNPPVCISKPMRVSVSSVTTLPSRPIVTVTAQDPDQGDNGTVVFSLAEEDEMFQIDESGAVRLKAPLSNEVYGTKLLRIRAADLGRPSLTSSCLLLIQLNGEEPMLQFTEELYEVTMPENSKTGSVFTNKPLNYVINGNTLRLLVEARDSGDPSLFSVTSVDIEVVDFNDNAPFFTQNSYEVSVPEDVSVGSTLLTLLAEDKDYSNKNTHLEYAIIGGNDERRFCLEVVSLPGETQSRTVGQIVICDTLNREATDTYSLTVTVTDRGTPPLNSSAVVSVKVLDINDNAPVFSSPEYHVQVTENSPLGTALIQISAYDPDLGANGTVTYNIISGNSRGLFRIDSSTGILEVNGTLDYEEDTKFTLTVQASDGNPSDKKLSFAVVYIMVLDENDNSPFFMFSTYNCSVPENLPAFTHVCTVHAVDEDAGTFGLLTYSFLNYCFVDYDGSNPDKKEAFGIDPLTGDIHTKQTFDYEGESEFCFVVEARDKGDQVATLRVRIEIEGIDEFSPIFTQNVYHFSLPTNVKVGQSIGQLMAMDHDGGLDGLVEYSLVNPSPFFSVNKTTGYLYISNSVYERRSPISNETIEDLTVLASSPKLDSRTSTCHVVVNISSSAKALTSVDLNVHIASLTVSLIVFLLLLISFIYIVLRYRFKENAVNKATSLSANLNHESDPLGTTGENFHSSGINLQDLQEPLDMWGRVGIPNPSRNSNSKTSSGRGSTEEETTEDQEIKMINKFARFKQLSSVTAQQASRVSDSGIPGDSDQLSFHSVDEDPSSSANIGIVQIVDMPSSESLHNFKDEGGGEGMLPQVVNMKEVEEVMRRCMSLSDDHGSVEGSLTNLISSEEQLHGSYSWDYFLNWQPRFQSLASVFTDIGMLPDEGMRARDVEPETQSLLRPPPLITGVAQPGIRAVPPRMPYRRSPLVRLPTYTKPHIRNRELTHSAMTPSFSPSLSVLTVRTPSSSPVVSETGLGSYTKIATLPRDILDEAEIQV